MRIAYAKSAGFRRAFTMIEVAISLAVIGFALVAIVGLLPMGLNTQKDNREDTVVSQDGQFFVEAIRGGVSGLDTLTNYVEKIVVKQYLCPINRMLYSNVYTYWNGYTNGEDIIALLSIPKYMPTNGVTYLSNSITAYVRAMSGSALMQAEMPLDPTTKSLGMRYLLRPEITPYNAWDRNSTNFPWPGTNTTMSADEILESSNRWKQISQLTNNLYEVRLRIEWPLLPAIGPADPVLSSNPKSQSFRTMVSGRNDFIFEPQTYRFK